MAVTLPAVSYESVVAHYEGDPAQLGSRDFVETQTKKAVGRLAARYGTRILNRLNSGVLSTELYEGTIAEAVLRILRNPDGFRMEQQGNYQYQLSSAVASGYLWFTQDNIDDLAGSGFSPIGTASIALHKGA